MPENGQVKVDAFVVDELNRRASALEAKLDADVLGLMGPIFGGCDEDIRQAIELLRQTGGSAGRCKLAVVLDTTGGVIEVVERIVKTIRHHYREVVMVIPNRAMSAGTVLAMSGDAIMMDYFSCLGPIDPQIVREHKLVPALSYLVQFDRLKERSEQGKITTAEIALLQQLDLAELHSFEEARELSVALLKDWLTRYKFKDWELTETRGLPVDAQMRERRALEVAEALVDHQKWHSDERPIGMETLRKDLNLRIDDFGGNQELSRLVKSYHGFLVDYMGKLGTFGAVHARGTFIRW